MLVFTVGASAGYALFAGRAGGAAAAVGRPAVLTPRAALPAAARQLRMVEVDQASSSIYDDFMGLDDTGASVPLALEEKEKLYLECLDAYYNEGGKEVLSENKYEQLKLDLEFSESKIMAYSKNEIKYLIANKRYKMGTPILSDGEYDSLRLTLKKEGSTVALHDSPTCRVDTGVCKMDLRTDKGKTRLLYLPGTVGGLLVFSELSFWFLHIDPLLSILLGAVPVYFFGKWFTENVFAQQPLVVTSPCPSCSALLTVYFGDLFSVQTDGILKGTPKPPEPQINLVCSNCKAELIADRDQMIISTLPKF